MASTLEEKAAQAQLYLLGKQSEIHEAPQIGRGGGGSNIDKKKDYIVSIDGKEVAISGGVAAKLENVPLYKTKEGIVTTEPQTRTFLTTPTRGKTYISGAAILGEKSVRAEKIGGNNVYLPGMTAAQKKEAYVSGQTKSGFLDELRSSSIGFIYGKDVQRKERGIFYDVAYKPYEAASKGADIALLKTQRTGEGLGDIGTNIKYAGASAWKGTTSLAASPLTTTAIFGAFEVAGPVGGSVGGTYMVGSSVGKKTSYGSIDPVGGIGETAGMVGPFAAYGAAKAWKPVEIFTPVGTKAKPGGFTKGRGSAFDITESQSFKVSQEYQIFGKKIFTGKQGANIKVDFTPSLVTSEKAVSIGRGTPFEKVGDFTRTIQPTIRGKPKGLPIIDTGFYVESGKVTKGVSKSAFEFRFKNEPTKIFTGETIATARPRGSGPGFKLFDIETTSLFGKPREAQPGYELLSESGYTKGTRVRRAESIVKLTEPQKFTPTTKTMTPFGEVEYGGTTYNKVRGELYGTEVKRFENELIPKESGRNVPKIRGRPSPNPFDWIRRTETKPLIDIKPVTTDYVKATQNAPKIKDSGFNADYKGTAYDSFIGRDVGLPKGRQTSIIDQINNKRINDIPDVAILSKQSELSGIAQARLPKTTTRSSQGFKGAFRFETAQDLGKALGLKNQLGIAQDFGLSQRVSPKLRQVPLVTPAIKTQTGQKIKTSYELITMQTPITTTIPEVTTSTKGAGIGIPPFGIPSFGLSIDLGRGFGRPYKIPKAKKQYNPSLAAVALNIKGPKPSEFKIMSGFGTRPILK